MRKVSNFICKIIQIFLACEFREFYGSLVASFEITDITEFDDFPVRDIDVSSNVKTDNIKSVLLFDKNLELIFS